MTICLLVSLMCSIGCNKDIKYDIPVCHECHEGHEGLKGHGGYVSHEGCEGQEGRERHGGLVH